MSEGSKSSLSNLGSPSLANVLGGSNLAIVIGLAMVLRDAAAEQVQKAEATQTAVARVEVKVESMATRFETVQEELADLKTQVARIRDTGASAADVRALEGRIERLEDCVRDKRTCRL